jgi:hypothetical protein
MDWDVMVASWWRAEFPSSVENIAAAALRYIKPSHFHGGRPFAIFVCA